MVVVDEEVVAGAGVFGEENEPLGQASTLEAIKHGTEPFVHVWANDKQTSEPRCRPEIIQ